MAELFHIGLTVRDIARSIRFYVDVAGLADRSPIEHASAPFDRLTGTAGARLLTVMLPGPGFRLQLIQYLTGGGDRLEPDHNRSGSVHLSFFIADAPSWRRELAARGEVTITSPLVTNASGTLRSFYVEDPDGVPVEFVEALRTVDYDRAATSSSEREKRHADL